MPLLGGHLGVADTELTVVSRHTDSYGFRAAGERSIVRTGPGGAAPLGGGTVDIHMCGFVGFSTDDPAHSVIR
ncbi:hypothetical protein GCM10023223_22760 [Stackebrandtia albiflava]